MALLPRPVRIATRGSALALAQARTVLAQCQEAFPDQAFELAVIKTTGDQQQTTSLTASDLPKGLFTKEIEVALLHREADLAVHSLKDLPTDLPSGLILGAVSRRADVRDILIFRDRAKLKVATSPIAADPAGLAADFSAAFAQTQLVRIAGLPQGITIATSSTRRAAQFCEACRDLQIIPIRGNVGTRLRKLAEHGDFDATVLAAAGLERLKYWTEPSGELRGPDAPDGLFAAAISLDEMLPCVGQGALGLEAREEDAAMKLLCNKLDDSNSRLCVSAERSFLRALGGGCHLAVAAYAEVQNGQLYMRAVSYLQEKVMRTTGLDALENADALGRRLAQSTMHGNTEG